VAKAYKLTESEVPERRTQNVYTNIVADFSAQGPEPMQITTAGLKPATLRPGLRRAVKGKEAQGVRLAQRGEETHLLRQATK
jgi:hypothetical protein